MDYVLFVLPGTPKEGELVPVWFITRDEKTKLDYLNAGGSWNKGDEQGERGWKTTMLLETEVFFCRNEESALL